MTDIPNSVLVEIEKRRLNTKLKVDSKEWWEIVKISYPFHHRIHFEDPLKFKSMATWFVNSMGKINWYKPGYKPWFRLPTRDEFLKDMSKKCGIANIETENEVLIALTDE
jgi:hypothetical protein